MTKRILVPVALGALLLSCGGGKKPPAHPEEEPIGTHSEPPPASTAGSSEVPPSDDADKDKKKEDCTGFDIPNIEDVLMKSACEVPLPRSTPTDLKGKLEVKVVANPPKTTPGGHVDLLVTFTNKTKDPMPLTFQIDPMPRFETEAFDVKGNRVDFPKTQPPPLKAGVPARVPSEPRGAKLTLLPNGVAKFKLGWDAVKTKWAPEKVAGTPPERGFPRAPAGPLPKGRYFVKVVTPLVGVFEGVEREMTAPRVEVVVEK
jgi:hypothetical protein